MSTHSVSIELYFKIQTQPGFEPGSFACDARASPLHYTVTVSHKKKHNKFANYIINFVSFSPEVEASIKRPSSRTERTWFSFQKIGVI